MTSTIDTTRAPSFSGREDYLAWRAQWRADYTALTAAIRASKAARSLPPAHPATTVRSTDTRRQAARRAQAARLLMAIDQSDLSYLRLDAFAMMTARQQAKEQAQAAYLARRAASQATQEAA